MLLVGPGSSLVPFGGPKVPLGTLGLIGPKRMDYSRMIPLVDFTAKAVGAKLEEMEGQLAGS